LLEHGRDASADQATFLVQRPTDIAAYLESRLPADQHWVIRHIKGEFAREVKRRRVALYEETGDRFWVARSQAQRRIAYVAADTDILDAVWADEATVQYLERQLRRLCTSTRAHAAGPLAVWPPAAGQQRRGDPRGAGQPVRQVSGSVGNSVAIR
jgi:hypothetical protein